MRKISSLIFALLVSGVCFASFAQESPENSEKEAFEQYRVLVDTIDQVSRNYVDSVSREELIEAAIEGVMKNLDPYSDYIPQRDIEGFRKNIDSKFGGLGVQVNERDGRIYVVAPLFGTPAYHADIYTGDQILNVDGQTTENCSVDDVVAMMKGEVGSEVTLKIKRQNRNEPFDVTMVRDIISIETVMGSERNSDDSWNYWLDAEHGIAYIYISTFGVETANELRTVLQTLQTPKEEGGESPLRALIIDLRFNPGGLFPVAVEVCDMFVNDGTIVSTKGRNAESQTWTAHKEATICEVPLVVMVNHYSASASEIVSACLQDHGRATIVGERSWGKGSVQNVLELEDGNSALKLTTAGYIRPNGKNIHRSPDATEEDEWGVLPKDEHNSPMVYELIVRLADDIRIRQELRTHRTDTQTPPRRSFQDPQLRIALEVLEEALDISKAPSRSASTMNRKYRRR